MTWLIEWSICALGQKKTFNWSAPEVTSWYLNTPNLFPQASPLMCSCSKCQHHVWTSRDLGQPIIFFVDTQHFLIHEVIIKSAQTTRRVRHQIPSYTTVHKVMFFKNWQSRAAFMKSRSWGPLISTNLSMNGAGLLLIQCRPLTRLSYRGTGEALTSNIIPITAAWRLLWRVIEEVNIMTWFWSDHHEVVMTWLWSDHNVRQSLPSSNQ